MSLRHARIIHMARIAAIIAAAACILIGVGRGEVSIVLRKAVRICLECIGVAG